jgi:hypothetical protein
MPTTRRTPRIVRRTIYGLVPKFMDIRTTDSLRDDTDKSFCPALRRKAEAQ